MGLEREFDLVSEKHSSSVDYHLSPLQVAFLHILVVFT